MSNFTSRLELSVPLCKTGTLVLASQFAGSYSGAHSWGVTVLGRM